MKGNVRGLSRFHRLCIFIYKDGEWEGRKHVVHDVVLYSSRDQYLDLWHIGSRDHAMQPFPSLIQYEGPF